MEPKIFEAKTSRRSPYYKSPLQKTPIQLRIYAQTFALLGQAEVSWSLRLGFFT